MTDSQFWLSADKYISIDYSGLREDELFYFMIFPGDKSYSFGALCRKTNDHWSDAEILELIHCGDGTNENVGPNVLIDKKVGDIVDIPDRSTYFKIPTYKNYLVELKQNKIKEILK